MSRYRPCPGVADAIAYLERRRMNCVLIAERNPPEAERATVQRQQLDLILGDLRAGMHEGLAETDAAMPHGCAAGLLDDPHDVMEV